MNQKMNDAQVWRQFTLDEAQWLDSIVRPMLPNFLVKMVEKVSHTPYLAPFGRLLHFFVDWIIIGKLLGLKIKRQRHTELQGGKGFRPGYQRGILKAIETVVEKRGVEIAKKKFSLNING